MAPSSVAFAHSAALIAWRFSSTRARTAATLITAAGARDGRSGIGRRRAVNASEGSGTTPLSSASEVIAGHGAYRFDIRRRRAARMSGCSGVTPLSSAREMEFLASGQSPSAGKSSP